MNNKLAAEMFGTFWLVFGGCGSAILAAAFPSLGIGFVGVSLAFGLSVLTMAYAVGGISGGHFNPAVTIGLAAAGKFDKNEVIPYVIAQVIGSVIAAAALHYILMGKAGAHAGAFATNGFDNLSPGGFSMHAALMMEVIMTGFFMIVILGATHGRGVPAGFAPIAIGLCLTLIHLVSIPVTNTSVNPARSTGVALFADTAAMDQLWFFWVAPILGAVLGAFVYKNIICGECTK